MFKKLLDLIKQAIKKMTGVKELSDIVVENIYTVSKDMQDAIEQWEQMYQDRSEWLDDDKGVYSLGIAPLLCSSVATDILNELKSNILEPGQTIKDIDESKGNEEEISTRAQYLNDLYHKQLLSNLQDKLEHALAVGGMIIKPYISNNHIYFDYCMQGEFVPIGFTDDGVLYDVVFYDDFIEGDNRYRRVERQMWNQENNTLTFINKAYVAKIEDITDKGTELGQEIPLSSVPRWSQISEEPQTLENIEKPLFGYYKVAKANNIDSSSPMGISIFSRAANFIKRTDIQFSRLDWEYEGGQMAVDVDITATQPTDSGFNTNQLRQRLYRKIDIGTDDTYNVFAPGLRDSQYREGLNYYLMHIEDLCEVSRGMLSNAQAEARTATEIKILKQRSYNTIARNQQALEKCLDSVIYSANALVDFYELAPDGEYTTTHEWSDSVLVDTDTELAQKIQLVSAGMLSKAEVRAWYCGEDIDTAKSAITEIQNEQATLMDLFSNNANEHTLEGDE